MADRTFFTNRCEFNNKPGFRVCSYRGTPKAGEDTKISVTRGRTQDRFDVTFFDVMHADDGDVLLEPYFSFTVASQKRMYEVHYNGEERLNALSTLLRKYGPTNKLLALNMIREIERVVGPEGIILEFEPEDEVVAPLQKN